MTDDYRAIKAVNWSALKYMRESPLAYKHALSTPREDSPALMIGRAVHALVFEPEHFDARFAVWEEGDRRGNAWKQFALENASKTILRADEAQLCRDTAGAVWAHPIARRHLHAGTHETPVTWTDPATGILCKALPDSINGDRVLIDLKTTRSVDGRRFGAEAARFAYPQQLAHYENACRHGLGWVPERVLLIAVEKAPPHDVGVFEIDLVAREIAGQEVAALLQRLHDCLARDEWPGRYSEEQALQLPAWVYTDDDEDADGFGLVIEG